MSNSFFLLCSLLFSPLKARYSNTQLFLDHDGRNQVHVLKETASTYECDRKLEAEILEIIDGGSANLTANELGEKLKCYQSSPKYMGTQDLKTADTFYSQLEAKLSTVYTGLVKVKEYLHKITEPLSQIQEITGIFKKENFPIVTDTNLEDHRPLMSLYNHIVELDTEKKRKDFLRAEIGFFSMEEFKEGIEQVITASVKEAKELKKNKVVVAVPLGNYGGDTQKCNKDAKYQDLVCKSSLWVLAHAFDHLNREFKEAGISIEFLFFLDDPKSIQALKIKYVKETTTMRWNLLDATYSGSEAEDLTKDTGGGFIRTLIAVGQPRSGLPMCQQHSEPESKVQLACIRIGKTWERDDLKHKIPYAKRTAAHFYVAWKCADKDSTGWDKMVASDIIGVAPYAKRA